MTVSLIIVAYNSESTLQYIFNDIVNQEYDKKLIEIILIDSMSTDNTKKIMKMFSEKFQGIFQRIAFFTNQKKTLPYGWNIGINESVNDVIIRVDAHARLDSRFVTNSIECILSGESICGGRRPNVSYDESNIARFVLSIENSKFGANIANYRNGTSKRYVKSVFHGAYKREVFEKVGIFNTALSRTEDNDMNSRIIASGYKICFSPDIISYQKSRKNINELLMQKYSNGYWIGKTIYVNRKAVSFFHLVPLFFVIYLVFLLPLTVLLILIKQYYLWFLIFTPLFLYIFMDIFSSINLILHNKVGNLRWLYPIILFATHFVYGWGTTKALLEGRK